MLPQPRFVRVLGVAVLLFGTGVLLAPLLPAQAQGAEDARRYSLQLRSGYRLDALRWNIAADLSGTLSPNILSELTWSDLQTWELGVDFRARLPRLLIPLSASVGWILSGENQDSDYNGDDRTLEFSRSNNKAGGWLIDATAAVGYPFAFLSGRAQLTPLLGLGYHAQRLNMYDGYQTVASALTPPLGPFPGLDSRYNARWLALSWAVELALAITPRLSLDSSLSAQAALYRAQADWNLRSDFEHPVSFAHEAQGWGLSYRAALSYRLLPRWSLSLGIGGELWRAGPGVDETYLDESVGGGTIRTRLNEVIWRSAAARLTTGLSL